MMSRSSAYRSACLGTACLRTRFDHARIASRSAASPVLTDQISGGRCRKFAPALEMAVYGAMEPAILDLVRELDDPKRRRDPELEVDIELLDDMLLDPWFLQSEAEIAELDDDPDARIHEIVIAARLEALEFA